MTVLGSGTVLQRLVLLWLARADLRLTKLAVPPVLPLIHRDLGLSENPVGLLSGLPVRLLGLAAIVAAAGLKLRLRPGHG